MPPSGANHVNKRRSSQWLVLSHNIIRFEGRADAEEWLDDIDWADLGASP